MKVLREKAVAFAESTTLLSTLSDSLTYMHFCFSDEAVFLCRILYSKSKMSTDAQKIRLPFNLIILGCKEVFGIVVQLHSVF
ncbi:hypothetical protein QYF36_013933 [Acer negundo]|nr:hypothetical protein QYF36_013933 [Acer negundo]